MSRERVPVTLRRQVKSEQEQRCLICDSFEHLSIHHILPVSHGGSNRRENLCGLCGECHDWADHMALTENIYLSDLIDMQSDVEYNLGLDIS